MFDISVTRFPKGINNSGDNGIFSDMPVGSFVGYHTYFDDFDYFVAANYTVTKTQGGATTALANGDGGLLLITNTTASSDQVVIQKVGASFQPALSFRTTGRFVASVDSLLANLVLGLVNVNTTPFVTGIQEGIWLSNVGSALSVNIALGGTVTTVAIPSSSILVAGSLINFSFYWDGGIYSVPGGRVVFEVSGPGVSARWRGEILAPTGFPAAVNLTPTVALQNSTGAGRTMTVDLMYVWKERTNPLATAG